MITVGREIATGNIVIRNLGNKTALILPPDADDLEMVIEMLVDELNHLHPEAEFILQSVEMDQT